MKFFKYGIDICHAAHPRYGGHSPGICKFFDVDYLSIVFYDEQIKENYLNTLFFETQWSELFKRKSQYYDGYHHHRNFYFFYVCWGGPPFNEGIE
jgi:hypothetical protein